MLSISHGITGAFIASQVSHPLLAIPLIFASHYLEDWIPHWDVGTGLSRGTRTRATAIKLELIELAIMVGLVIWFWPPSTEHVWYIWAGSLVGLLPDFMEAPRNFLKWEPAFLKPFNDLHGMFHHSTPHIVFGLVPQIVVVVCLFFLKG